MIWLPLWGKVCPERQKLAAFTVRTTVAQRVALIAVAYSLQLGWGALAQSFPTDPIEIGEAMYYIIERGLRLYSEPRRAHAIQRLKYRDPVFVSRLGERWSVVHTQEGTKGYVPSDAISNIWIRVSKLRKRLYLYKGTELVMAMPADFGYNSVSDKVKRGSDRERSHWRTPEGAFYVVTKNPHSKFYKAFLLNYPSREDAQRGLRTGLITRMEHDRIMAAESVSEAPPMNTMLGGMIEIHGEGTGQATNWTQGCVAVENHQMDRLWAWVHEGTPVIIEK